MPSQPGTRWLIVRTDRLGETVLTLPAVAAVRDAHPTGHIALMVQPALAGLMRAVDGIDEVIEAPLAGPWWAQVLPAAHRMRGFDTVLLAHPYKAWHAAAWLAGVPRRVGYDRKWGGLLTHRLPDRKALGDRHEVAYNLDVVRAVGVASPQPRWPALRTDPEEADIDVLCAGLSIKAADAFVLHPWTSHPSKQWPIDRYTRLAERIMHELQAPVLVIGGAHEARQPWTLPEGAVNLAGRLSLLQTAALLRRCRLLVTNDSGPMHLAALVGTRIVALFGSDRPATGPGRWGPWGAPQTVIHRPSMEAITLEEVFAAVQGVRA